jgi:hypothetical protein
MGRYFNPPEPPPPPAPPNVTDLIRYLVERVREAAESGGPIYPLLVTGDQGVGKSRLLAALAVELRRAGFRVWYDLELPSGQYDYIILDDLGALVTAWEWQTKAGRLLKKVEILIRNIGRWGYTVGAPRAGDILKNFREKAKQLLLVSRSELKHEYGVETPCDVVAVYVKQVTMFDATFATHTYVWPLRGRKYCIKWGEFKWYQDPEWRMEYERVQAKREDLLRKWLGELDMERKPESPVEKVVKWIVERSYELLKGTRVATPNPADAVAMAVTKFGERLYENKLTATLDAVRIYADLVHEVAGTTLAEFARMVNEVAGKEVARVGKNKKKHFVELSYEDFIELVRAVEGAP